ncbi:hypothetical protein J437_LFUL002243 [Ladona fulva]|uniref:Uncharacterized protein n=1 Tax=Ladona fulva TaxID=123851 RepID=A0A8K0JYP5_LADFU|nr:hypothetical protein J437_LFUL002243 [Ladona fulva]
MMLTESRSSLQVKILPVGQEFASPSFGARVRMRTLGPKLTFHTSTQQPQKAALRQVKCLTIVNHPGRVMTNYQIAEIFGQAHERTATMGKGIKGFELCGIFPVNRNVFSDDDFLPSSVTDQPMPVHHRAHLNETVGLTEQKSTEKNVADVTDQAESSFSRPNGRELIDAVITPVKERTVKKWTSPADVIPLPKRQEAQKWKSNKQKSDILTRSPFNDKLIAAE